MLETKEQQQQQQKPSETVLNETEISNLPKSQNNDHKDSHWSQENNA